MHNISLLLMNESSPRPWSDIASPTACPQPPALHSVTPSFLRLPVLCQAQNLSHVLSRVRDTWDQVMPLLLPRRGGPRASLLNFRPVQNSWENHYWPKTTTVWRSDSFPYSWKEVKRKTERPQISCFITQNSGQTHSEHGTSFGHKLIVPMHTDALYPSSHSKHLVCIRHHVLWLIIFPHLILSITQLQLRASPCPPRLLRNFIKTTLLARCKMRDSTQGTQPQRPPGLPDSSLRVKV